MRKTRTKAVKKVTANLSHKQEIINLINQFPNAEIPREINETNKHCFNFLGLNVRKGGGLSIDLNVKLFTKDVNVWEAMTDFQKTPSIMGNFESVIMIHDPYIEEEETQFEEVETGGRMTKAKKTKINKMMENGDGHDDDGLKTIADKVGLSFKQVKEYIQSN